MFPHGYLGKMVGIDHLHIHVRWVDRLDMFCCVPTRTCLTVSRHQEWRYNSTRCFSLLCTHKAKIFRGLNRELHRDVIDKVSCLPNWEIVVVVYPRDYNCCQLDP